jgi:hypothetical protein
VRKEIARRGGSVKMASGTSQIASEIPRTGQYRAYWIQVSSQFSYFSYSTDVTRALGYALSQANRVLETFRGFEILLPFQLRVCLVAL